MKKENIRSTRITQNTAQSDTTHETVLSDHSRYGRRLFFLLSLLVIYLAFLSYGLFFAESMNRSLDHVSYNITPFREIGRIVEHGDVLGWHFVAINLGGNIIAFLPFGFLLSAIWPQKNPLHSLVLTLLVMTFSAVVEWLQYNTGVGVADIDDVILNTLGGFLGCELEGCMRNASSFFHWPVLTEEMG